jgi:protein-S-isoprenylcysteine O-methyltransferase Ste14
MNNPSKISPTEMRSNLAAGIAMRVGTIAVFLILQMGILFLAAGRLNWMWPWVYMGISLVIVIINGTIMLRTSPETIVERGKPKETKDWDKIVAGLLALAQYLVLPFVAGLDVRFGWTRELSLAWHMAGAAGFVLGLGIFCWAMITNAYFSTAVRIQSDRGHTVCRSGPYRFVRHPGYVGFILQFFGTPVLLGSVWALIPASMAAVILIIRTSLEDRTLQAELPGYQDYVQEVRYRLLPGIW